MSKSKRGNPSHSKAGRAVLDGGFYLLGSVLYALSVNIFTAPNQIAPGGVTGVATLLNYAFHLPIGTMILVINLPLLIAAWYKCGAAFTVRTLIVTVLSSAIIDGTARFLPPFRGDKILVALFGGVLAGAGLGLIYLRGATTGGSEVVARLLERWGHITAVGTTSVRTLESLAALAWRIRTGGTPDAERVIGQWEPYDIPSGYTGREALEELLAWMDAHGCDRLKAATRIMITPLGYEFRIVRNIVTNFHQPKSTLLLLVSAFVGEEWRNIYDYALDHGFRFLSYGDSSVLLRE